MIKKTISYLRTTFVQYLISITHIFIQINTINDLQCVSFFVEGSVIIEKSITWVQQLPEKNSQLRGRGVSCVFMGIIIYLVILAGSSIRFIVQNHFINYEIPLRTKFIFLSDRYSRKNKQHNAQLSTFFGILE